ncbi:MAG TPA: hypothetical protein VMY34_05250 [Acidimicrobiales bacterium]|nr:hypothetical protein [Acidimicrobiales bacterium]
MTVSRDQRLILAFGILLFTALVAFTIVTGAGTGGDLAVAAFVFAFGTVIAASVAPGTGRAA